MSVEYRKLMDEREAMNVRRHESEDAVNAGFDAELAAAYKAKFPKRKFSKKLSLKNNPEEHHTIFLKWQEKATALSEAYCKERDELRGRMKAVALAADIPAFAGMTLFKTVDSGTYRSQGFGEHKYARAAAEDYLDKAKSYGLDAHLREVLVAEGRDSFGWPWKAVEYEVWVSTDEVGVEILGLKPDKETMEEWAKKCRERGVNMRVFMSFLSADDADRLERGVA